MKAQKYIKSVLFTLLVGAFMVPQVNAMKQKKETFSQWAFRKGLTFGIPAVIGGIVAYSYFPKSAYNFLNPQHLYHLPTVGSVEKSVPFTLRLGQKIIKKVTVPTLMWATDAFPASALNAVRSALFSGIFHADNIRGATTGLVAGIAGCAGLRFTRAGIFGIGGSDRTKINTIADDPGTNNHDRKLNLLAGFIPGSRDDIKRAIKKKALNGKKTIPSDVTLKPGQKRQIKDRLDTSDLKKQNAKTFYEKAYFKVDDATQSPGWYKKYPAIGVKSFLRVPKVCDAMVNEINKINYTAYSGSAITGGVLLSLLQTKVLGCSLDVRTCLFGGLAGLAIRFAQLRISYPTRYYAAERFCKVYLNKL